MDKYINLRRARHHLIFLAALIFGSVLIYFLNGIDMRKQGLGVIVLKNSIAPEINITKTTLTKEEIGYAKTAWRYFENNYHESTGMVNSVNKFPSSTLWDMGNYLMALIAANELHIIDANTYDSRVSKILTSLGKLPLYQNLLPNKAYNSETLQMTNYDNKVSKKGIGWSAIDIGRILIPLSYIEYNQPQYSQKLHTILSRWNIKKMTKEGSLYGAVVKKGKESILQEGRLGYEQYSSKMFATFGVDITNALRYDKYLEYKDIYDINIPYDRRDKEHSNANNYVLMEPYMLDGLEFGWDYFSHEFSYRLYKAQEKRYQDTGILTAVTEDHIDQAPYFIYNSIFVNKKEWVAIDETGKVHQNLKQLSTKASIVMDILYDTSYTHKLMEKVKTLQSPEGWYAGIYEKDNKVNKALTCNTNAIILEALFYKQHGPIVKMIGN